MSYTDEEREADEQRDRDVVLSGECAGLTMRGVYRRGARVEFECCDAADRREA